MKTIICDVDGVIFRTFDKHGKYLWCETVEQDLGLSLAHIKKIFSTTWMENVLKGKIETTRYLNEVFEEPIFQHLPITAEIFMHYWTTKDQHINSEIIQLIGNLKNPIYLGTNQEAYRTAHIIQSIGSYFKGCFASYQIGATKPDSRFFLHIEHVLGLMPSELILIDDTLSLVEGAKKCGWNTYHYHDNVEKLKVFINSLSNN